MNYNEIFKNCEKISFQLILYFLRIIYLIFIYKFIYILHFNALEYLQKKNLTIYEP